MHTELLLRGCMQGYYSGGSLLRGCIHGCYEGLRYYSGVAYRVFTQGACSVITRGYITRVITQGYRVITHGVHKRVITQGCM